MIELKFKKGFEVFQQFSNIINSLNDNGYYILKIKKYRKKRSLDANAYFWVLCDELAKKTREDKIEIYKGLIKKIGGNRIVVCVPQKEVDKFILGWERGGLGWLTLKEKSKIEGCINVTLFYGSSTYDSGQMSKLISLVYEKCRENGIETMTQNELKSLCDRWRG